MQGLFLSHVMLLVLLQEAAESEVRPLQGAEHQWHEGLRSC